MERRVARIQSSPLVTLAVLFLKSSFSMMPMGLILLIRGRISIYTFIGDKSAVAAFTRAFDAGGYVLLLPSSLNESFVAGNFARGEVRLNRESCTQIC